MVFILALFLMTADAAPLAGTLCIDESRDCAATSGTTIDVSESDAPRVYVWTSDDGRTVVVGEIAPGESRIDLGLPSSSGRPAVRLSVRGDAARGWPANTRFTLTQSKEKRWVWTLPAGRTRGDVTIHLPEGEYRMWVAAARHRPESRVIRADADLALGEIRLQPLPRVSGRVTKLDDESVVPVAGAEIVLPDGKIAATTDEQGAFRVELPQPVPEEMKVASPGLGTHVVPLQRLDAENDIGEIRLETGVTLRMDVERAGDVRDATIRVQLNRKSTARYEPSQLESRELSSDEEWIAFTDLSPGDYYVQFAGDHELERMVVPVEVGAVDVNKRVEIRPYRLEGRVTFGDEPLGEATVSLSPYGLGPTWKTAVPTDRDGRFGGTLWQTGRLTAQVKPPSDSLGGLMYTYSSELGRDPSRWDIHFQNRTIHGRIFDAESGVGIGGVRIRLQTEISDGRWAYSHVQVDESGEYELVAWQDARYDLTVTTENHLPKKTSVVLSETDGSRKVDFPMDRGTGVTLELVWTAGGPVAGAQIVEGIARDGHNPERFYTTDAAGRLTLRVAKGETRVLYVLPREGSLAVARVSAAAAGERPMRIEVLPPAGTLALELRDADGNPADAFIILLRYNGEWIPYPASGRMRGARIEKGKHELYGLPAGAWEIWALAPSNEPRGIPNVVPSHPPVRVGIASGVTKAEVTVVPID